MRGRYHGIVSDPPYGIGYQFHGGGVHRGGVMAPLGRGPRIAGDDRPFDPAPLLEAGVPCLLWGADHFRRRLPDGGSWLSWDKRAGGRGPDDTFTDGEFAWCSVPGIKRNTFAYLWKGLARDKTGEDKDHDGRHRRRHPMQKPILLMRWCIGHLGLEPGATIIDPYMGSGSTGIAAIQLGFNFIGAEIDPGHYKRAQDRLAGFA
jgi:site-specific DNA-methyltransferase (adenine-specific)/modification methylase